MVGESFQGQPVLPGQGQGALPGLQSEGGTLPGRPFNTNSLNISFKH